MYLWYWWLLVTIILLCPSGEPSHSTNTCPDSVSNGFKTWGPNCQRLCHCRDEGACDFEGYCENGCMHGWTRLTPSGSCSVPFLDNSKSSNTLYVGFHNRSKIREQRQAPFVTRRVPPFIFSQDAVCTKFNKWVRIKFAYIRAAQPILCNQFKVIFKVKPRPDDITKATFSIKDFATPTVTHLLRYYSGDQANTLSVRNLQYVLVDDVAVSIASPIKKTCSPAVVDGYVLSGKPICPYGKFGNTCERNCPCQCRWSDCHPNSGRCLDRGLICPVTKFGQLCSRNCSTHCLGNPRECHPQTGFCKKCQHRDKTGVHCNSAMTPEEQSERNKPCKDSTGSSVFDNQSTKIQRSNYAIAIIVLVFLIIFLIICCCYIQVVQYCAKRRIKDRMFDLDEARKRQSSMVTYTEFKKEFIELEKYRKSSQVGRSRSDNPFHDRPDKPIHFGSHSETGTSPTSAESRFDASKRKSMSASKIQQTSPVELY